MATISGRLMFDRNRTATSSAALAGIASVAIVLQNINTNAALGSLTNASGNYSFTNVPNGNYRIVEVFGYQPALPTPADFDFATIVSPITEAVVPPIEYATNPPQTATHLDCTTKNTRLVTVSGSNLTGQNFLNGPVTYTPISTILDNDVVVLPDNLITNADLGTFGQYTMGTNANVGVSVNPYTNLGTDFVYVLPNPSSVTPNDGQYTIQNIMNNSHSNSVGTWWVIADHSKGDETGRMMVINGDNPGAVIFRETLAVEPNTYYLFSSWILNLCKIGSGYANPSLGVAIFDEQGQPMYQATLGELIPIRTTNPEWKQVGTVFYSNSSSTVTLQFVSMGPAATGNDYVIDDISINEVALPDYCPTKSANKSIMVVGETVQYSVCLENSGIMSLTNVFFKDELPSAMEFVAQSVFVNGTNYPLLDPNVGFFVPDIEGGTTLVVEFSATAQFVPSPNPTPNQAQVSYCYSPVLGGIPMEYYKNTNEVFVQIMQQNWADMMVQKTSQTIAIVGSYHTYKLVATNLGTSNAENVVVSDQIPQLLEPAEYSTDMGISWDTWNGTFNAGTLAPDEFVELLIRGIVKPTTELSVSNTATVDSTTPDPDLSNNTSTVTDQIVNPMSELADLSIKKTTDPSSYVAGQTLTYTLKIDNYGPNDAIDTVVTDAVPAALFNPEYSIDGGAWQAWQGHYDIGTLAANDSITITLRGTIDPLSRSTLINTATIDSTTPDPDLSNNTSTTRTSIKPEINITRNDAINILVTSIGLEEISLAHIINAEGEKIQYALGTLNGAPPTDATICDVQQINNSVNKTLKGIIATEMLLDFKLEDALYLATPDVPDAP